MREVVSRRNYEAIRYRLGRDAGSDLRFDSYRERLLKYIPVEIIVIYIAIYASTYSLVGSDPSFTIPARWLVIAGIVCTPLYLYGIERVHDVIQLIISTIGFCAWIFALGVIPVSELPWFNQVGAAVFLLVYVFLVPLADGIPESAG